MSNINKLGGDNRPTISVIMPCCKSEKYIEAAVKDLLAQTYSDWELIAVSNGNGQDLQLEILNSFAADHKDKIEVISVELGNVSNSRNIGIDHAHGDWIFFMDADDRLDANHLELMMSKTGEDVDVLIGGFAYCDDNNNVVSLCPIECDTEFLNAKGMVSNYSAMSSVCNKMFRTEFLRRSSVSFDPTLIRGQDICFIASIMQKTSRIKWLRMCGYRYNVHPINYKIPHYVPEWLRMRRTQIDFFNKLQRQAGIYNVRDGQIYAHDICVMYLEAVRNLFRVGAPFTYNDARSEIRRIIFNNIELADFITQLDYTRNSSKLKLFSLCYRTKSPAIMAFVFLVMEKSNLIFQKYVR